MKIARIGKNNNTQSVKEHLNNVSNFCVQLAEKINLKNTAYLAGLLHDMGKFSNEFQNYIKSEIDSDKTRTKVDHAVYGAKYIYKLASKDPYEQITSQIISLVICYHHGGLPDSIDSNNEVSLLKRIYKLTDDDSDYVFNEFKETFNENNLKFIFKESVSEIKYFLDKLNININNGESKLFTIHLLIKTLYSILIDSDWFDSYLFESNVKFEKTDTLEQYIDDYILNFQKQSKEFKKLKAKTKLQQIVFDIRNEISDDCLNFASNKTGIYTLTVPTGGGKTQSSLNFALNHAKIHNKDRIIYIAPYTSIIEQNAEDIRKTLKCGDKLLEYHSNVISEISNKEDFDEDTNHIKVLSSRWNYPIVFSTMVQFLNILFGESSQDIRKLQSLINSVIIFDEAQSVPLRCTSLFNEAVNYLNMFLNCTVVLCTATQPVLNEVKKPIKLSSNSEIINNVNKAYESLKRVEVIDKTIPGGYSYDELINFLLNLKKNNNNKSILLVVNTIKTAEELFNLVKNSDHNSKIYYLCSNLCPAHRKIVVDNIKTSLKNNESVICISTQVIECGVDISFSTVIRSLAGLDSVAQASGRCNRHGEAAISNTYIINFGNDLEKTDKMLSIDIGKKKTIKILELYKKKPGDYDNSLLSTKTIYNYFMNFINEKGIEEQLDYFLKKENISIYELLSLNNKKNNYEDIKQKKYPLAFCFQFKTARSNFKVIDDNTKAVIVPFNEGKEIINDLISSKDIMTKFKLLKKSQHYSVNIYENKFINLNKLGAIAICEVEGVYLLKDGFYDKDVGVILDKNMESLIS